MRLDLVKLTRAARRIRRYKAASSAAQGVLDVRDR